MHISFPVFRRINTPASINALPDFWLSLSVTQSIPNIFGSNIEDLNFGYLLLKSPGCEFHQNPIGVRAHCLPPCPAHLFSKVRYYVLVLHRYTGIPVNTGSEMRPDYRFIEIQVIDMAKWYSCYSWSQISRVHAIFYATTVCKIRNLLAKFVPVYYSRHLRPALINCRVWNLMWYFCILCHLYVP